MTTVVKILLPVLFSIMLSTAVAQKQKPATAKPSTVQKFKPPKLYCSLGIHNDSATVYVEEAVQLVTLPLKIIDDKKNIYAISSYQLMYKRKAVTEDEVTGKVTPVTSNVAELFRATPITPLWKNILIEQMKPGDELYFFDIIAKDAQGRYMFAPELKIKIK